MNTLAIISDKELSGEPFTAEELDFLSDVLYFGEHCVPYESGWYRDLFFSRSEEPTQEKDLLIADVHTQPTDEGEHPWGMSCMSRRVGPTWASSSRRRRGSRGPRSWDPLDRSTNT